MNYYTIFCDASAHPQTKAGVGAYLLIKQSYQAIESSTIIPTEANIRNCKGKMFENTSSTKCELQTFLWVIDDIKESLVEPYKITFCTDSQGITSLERRKEKLIKNNFNNYHGIELHNAEFYKEFYKQQDIYKFNVIKVKGHSPKSQQTTITSIFSIIDKFTRNELRLILEKNGIENSASQK